LSSSRRAAFDASLALVIRVASAGLVFLLQVMLARLMPADGYGGFVTLWTWMLALGSFAALGFAESSVRFLPRYHLRNRWAMLHGYWRFALGAVLVASTAMAALAAAVAVFVGVEDGPGLTMLLVALGLPFLAMEYLLEGVARSFGWFRLSAVPVYIVRPLLIGGACLGLAWSGVTLTLPVVGMVLIGSMALVAIGVALLLARQIDRMTPAGRKARAGEKRLWLLASLPLLLLSGVDDIMGHADVLLLSLFVPAEEVGIYFAAARCLALSGFVAYAMTLVAGRRFALDLAGRSREELQRNIIEATRMTLWATLGSVALALVAGPYLLAAFGPEYGNGIGVMWVLGAGMVARALAGQAGEVLIVTGRLREGVLIAAAGLAVTLVAGVVLIPLFGLLGAAAGAALGMACRTICLVVVVRRVEGLRVVSLGFPGWRAA
jgi:O-antigen/teichoic acid export membrane protein